LAKGEQGKGDERRSGEGVSRSRVIKGFTGANHLTLRKETKKHSMGCPKRMGRLSTPMNGGETSSKRGGGDDLRCLVARARGKRGSNVLTLGLSKGKKTRRRESEHGASEEKGKKGGGKRNRVGVGQERVFLYFREAHRRKKKKRLGFSDGGRGERRGLGQKRKFLGLGPGQKGENDFHNRGGGEGGHAGGEKGKVFTIVEGNSKEIGAY